MSKRISVDIKDKIKFLRSHGYSQPEISREVKVSMRSVLRYIQGVEILPEFLSEWAGKRGGSRKIRLRKETEAFEEGKKLVRNLSQREKMIILSTLYWAEGTKKDFSLANTDPNLIKVFIECMRDVFKIKNSDIYVNIRLYSDLDKEAAINFWANVVSINPGDVRGTNILEGKKKGKLEYGMCRIRIAKGADKLKKIKGINRAIFEDLSL